MKRIFNKARAGLLLILIVPAYVYIILATVLLAPSQVLDELSNASKTGYKV